MPFMMNAVCWALHFILSSRAMVASMFLIVGLFRMGHPRLSGIIQLTSLNSLFQRTMLTALLQTRNGYCWQWINLAITMKQVILRSARMDTYISQREIVFATLQAKRANLRRTHSLCSEKSCALM